MAGRATLEWNTCLYLSLTLFKCNVPDFIILLRQTPDDFTCNRECWLIGLIRQSVMHPVDPDVPYYLLFHSFQHKVSLVKERYISVLRQYSQQKVL